MFCPFTGVKDIKFDNTILVVSSMGIGDIGNLAIDLLSLNNQDIRKIGYYKSKYMQSIVGNMDIINYVQSLSLPAEIFQSKNVTYLQFRGRVRTGRKKAFLEELSEFFKKSQFKEIIVLSGAEGSNMPQISKEGTQVFANIHENNKQSCLDLSKFVKCEELAKVMDTLEKKDEVMFGTGLGRALYKAEELFKEFKIVTLFIQTQTPQFDIQRALILLRDFVGALQNIPEIKKLEFKNEEVFQQTSYKLPPFFTQN